MANCHLMHTTQAIKRAVRHRLCENDSFPQVSISLIGYQLSSLSATDSLKQILVAQDFYLLCSRLTLPLAGTFSALARLRVPYMRVLSSRRTTSRLVTFIFLHFFIGLSENIILYRIKLTLNTFDNPVTRAAKHNSF